MAKLSHEISSVKKKMESIKHDLGKMAFIILVLIKFSNVLYINIII